MNLMQYLSVGGALESPREKHFSRRIGSKKSEPADAVARESARMEPVILVEPSRLEDDQGEFGFIEPLDICLLYTSPSPRDATLSRMPSSA